MDHSLTSSASEIPALLRRYGIHPDKSLGQNFLVDNASLNKVIEAASLSSEDTVLEIGAGLGNLTRLLAAQASQVVAVELDSRLIPLLKDLMKPFTNVRLVQGDILSLDTGDLMGEMNPGGRYLVVANIPYYITSAVVRHLLEASLHPHRIILTMQREVAERICAQPGDLSLLALSVQVFGKPLIMEHIPAGAFYPSPKVDSAVIRVDLYPTPLISPDRLATFFRLARAGFSQKRKTIRNALAGSLGQPPKMVENLLGSAGIDPMRRAETLDLQEWSHLTEGYCSK